MEDYYLIIAGGRDFNDYPLLKEKVDDLLSKKSGDLTIIIISGIEEGADMLGEKYAAEMGYEVQEFPAYWILGNEAGAIRNQQMTDAADACICFWDGHSRDTADVIGLANKKGIPVRVISY